MSSRSSDARILLSHGGGGLRTHQLLKDILFPLLSNPILDRHDDSACFEIDGTALAMTTDSFVVNPPFFPGGDIGRLAVCGTVNDLAMQAAEPRYLSLALILEEGFPLQDLRRITESIASAAAEAGVIVVTGDTKVVEHGHGAGLFITTAGIGRCRPGISAHAAQARPGDAVLVSGTLGDHGVAVMSAREGLAFETDLLSDVAPLGSLVKTLVDAVPDIHVLRDPTRGGLAAALNDIAEAAGVGIRIEEDRVPVRPAVRNACRLLGLDPLTVANEGKAVVICPATQADAALEALRSHPLGRGAVCVGQVTRAPAGRVILRTALGGERLLDMPMGDDLPRIC